MTSTRARRGIVALATIYGMGRDGVGWVCRDCDRTFRHHGKRKLRVALAVLDHVVLDHRRLPFYRHPGWSAPTFGFNWTSTTATGHRAVINYTITTPSITFTGPWAIPTDANQAVPE